MAVVMDDESYVPWRLQKWLTIGGSFMLLLPIGVTWYWGNIGVYALSYIAMRGKTGAGVGTPWVISVYFLCCFIGIYFAGFAVKPSTKRLVLFSGMGLFTGGIFLTYYTVQISVFMTTISIGLVSGIGGGLVNGMALRYSVAWAGKSLGLVTSFIQSGCNAGPVLINPLITWFVNPGNDSPCVEIGSIKLFSQPELLDKVPFSFIILGFTCLVLQIIGFASVRDAVEKPPEEIKLISSEEGVNRIITADLKAKTKLQETTDKTPMEMLQEKSFYILWLSFMLCDNAMLVLANYYKDYGAVWIDDDYFLAFLGNALTVATIVGFSSWGFVSDRMGIKRTMILMLAVSSLLCLLAYFTPMVNQWLYMVNITLLGFVLPPMFSILVVATCQLFGKTYHNSNVVFASSLSLAMNFLNPLMFEYIVDFGWFYVFGFAGGLCFVSLVIVIFGLSET